MGQITYFNLNSIINQFKCSTYVETGTGIGVSLQYALGHSFEKYYTVDIDKDLQESTKQTINDSRVEYINGLSTESLKYIVPKLEGVESVLFFLDAHLPGSDFHKMTYEDSMKTYKEHSLPLEEELRIINNLRDIKNDVIVIDDLQLYDDGPYQHKTWIHEDLQKELGLRKSSKFIEDMFKKTHDIETHYAHQGYLLITPKLKELK
jgi:hypothetical protein